jgi:tRNA 5-methylaminomethyl-2-thiouridine biosynthesis bifunctional protein
MNLTLPPIQPAKPSWGEGTPISDDYGDTYFSAGQGLAESTLVFIEANQLADRFSRLDANGLFVIGETGFGTGLNCLLAARCFSDNAPQGAQLHLVSTELHPLSPADLSRGLSQWPELGALASRLLAAYPPPAPGCHRLRLAENIELTLLFGDAHTMLMHYSARMDAWFLDGFAPARNEAMWQPALLQNVARLSQPGATLGTFTAAAEVRRGLAEAGFEVDRLPGFGHKRHRLIGRQPGPWQPQQTRRAHAIVAGAGLAGATTARALAERGWQVSLIDPRLDPDLATPEHLAGVLYATASAHLHPQNRFYQSALLRAMRWLQRLAFPAGEDQGRLEGVIQHLTDARMREKTLAAIDSGAWPDALLTRSDEDSVCFEGAGYVQPLKWIAHLLDHPSIELIADRVGNIQPGPVVRLGNRQAMESDALVLCTAGATGQLSGLGWLPLRTVRGQVSFCRATQASRAWRQPHCHSGYLTPAVNGVHSVGATFDRQRSEAVIDPADDVANLSELATGLPKHWAALGGASIELVGRHAGLRCQSPDTLPLAGPLADPVHNPHRIDPAIWLNIAHGSKGLAHTPLCADLIADSLSAHPPPVDDSILAALAPQRFILRQRRRDPNWTPKQ